MGKNGQAARSQREIAVHKAKLTVAEDARGRPGVTAVALGVLDPSAAACVSTAGPVAAACAGARATAQRTAAAYACGSGRESEREVGGVSPPLRKYDGS